jgi:hypothetical protein
MSLFPEENILTKEIESWRGFADTLKSEEDRKLFLRMLNDCQKYALAINAKETPFPTEHLIMALLLTQHKMMGWLSEHVPKKMRSAFPKVELQEGFDDSSLVMKRKVAG